MRKATTIIMIVVLMALIAWDIIVVAEPTAHDSISRITLDTAQASNSLPLALGALMGHLLVPRSIEWGTATRFICAGILLLVAIGIHWVPIPIWSVFLAGFPLGFLLWPQAKKE